MKKYICLIGFCLIYYWPVEVLIIGVAGGWYVIVRYERHQRQEYLNMPDEGYIFSNKTDIIPIDTTRFMEFTYDSMTELKEKPPCK